MAHQTILQRVILKLFASKLVAPHWTISSQIIRTLVSRRSPIACFQIPLSKGALKIQMFPTLYFISTECTIIIPKKTPLDWSIFVVNLFFKVSHSIKASFCIGWGNHTDFHHTTSISLCLNWFQAAAQLNLPYGEAVQKGLSWLPIEMRLSLLWILTKSSDLARGRHHSPCFKSLFTLASMELAASYIGLYTHRSELEYNQDANYPAIRRPGTIPNLMF